MPTLDPRLNAFRNDLANIKLKGTVSAKQYVTASTACVTSHFADVHKHPDQGSMLQTQILHGHEVNIFDRQDGWAWIQYPTDGYVGYVREEALAEPDANTAALPTHMIVAPRTFLYGEPDLKLGRLGYRSMGSKLCVTDNVATRGTNYSILASGEAVISSHLIKLNDWQADPVSVAETLIHTPYLWGGSTGFGIDCSGLVSLSYMLCGQNVLRDTDMQTTSIGQEIPMQFDQLKRGDLVFWNGHVGMMADGKNLLHANGNTMDVAIEPLDAAIERIGYLYEQPTMVRRA